MIDRLPDRLRMTERHLGVETLDHGTQDAGGELRERSGGRGPVLGIGVGMLMQNLVLAAQNDVPANELGAATSVLTFFRSMGGAIGVSALGAVLANRVTALMTERLGPAAAGGGSSAAVPDLSTLPEPLLRIVQDVYGTATAELFLVGAPLALLAMVVVLFIREKPLHTLSGDERRAQEEAAQAEALTH